MAIDFYSLRTQFSSGMAPEMVDGASHRIYEPHPLVTLLMIFGAVGNDITTLLPPELNYEK